MSPAETPMQRLGYDGEAPVFYAKPGVFVRPGIYRWNGTDHDLLLELTDEPTAPMAGLAVSIADAEEAEKPKDRK